MTPFLQFILTLAIIIIAAKGAGLLSNRLGQPAVLGELLAGLLLGPTLLDMLHWPFLGSESLGESVSHLAELGVLFLMFIAGLEVDLAAMRRAGRPAVWAGVLGVVAPIALALCLVPFGFDLEHALFIGLVLAATSVSISAQTLIEMGMLRSKVGLALLGAAVVDDVLVILALSLFLALATGAGGGLPAVIVVVARVLAYFAAGLWLGWRFLPRLSEWIERTPISQGVVALALVTALLYAWSAEVLGGVAAITGTFLAGVLFGRTSLKHRIETGMSAISYAWLVPVFFVSIGLHADLRSIGLSDLPLTLLLLVIALVSKVLGSGLGGLFGGLSRADALRLGVGMISRGEVGLIVASLGLGAGLVSEALFAEIVLIVLVTTLVTPILLRALYAGQAGAPQGGPRVRCERVETFGIMPDIRGWTWRRICRI